MVSVSRGFLSKPGGRCPSRSSAPVQRPFQAAAGGILNIKAFISSAIKNLGNAILKRIAVAYPKTFLSGLLGCPSFLCVDHGRGREGGAV